MAQGRPGKPLPDGGSSKRGANDATTGYEAELWRMADTLRGSMDAAEYSPPVATSAPSRSRRR